MQFNTEYFKRWSTWFNLAEVVIATVIQLAVDLPDDLAMPMWAYVGLRITMAVVQAVKQNVDKD